MRPVTMICLLGVLSGSGSATAQTLSDEVPDLWQARLQIYAHNLDLRDNAVQAGVTAAVLDEFDGEVLVETFVNSHFYQLRWQSGRGLVTFVDGVDVQADAAEDAYLRHRRDRTLTFEEEVQPGVIAERQEYVNAWVDVWDGRLHVALTVDDASFRWHDGLPISEEYTSGMALITLLKKKCVCKGSLERNGCSDPDCTNNEFCTTASTKKCIFSHVPVGRAGAEAPPQLQVVLPPGSIKSILVTHE